MSHRRRSPCCESEAIRYLHERGWLVKALRQVGYPPIKREQSKPGPSAHYATDYETYAGRIAAVRVSSLDGT